MINATDNSEKKFLIKKDDDQKEDVSILVALCLFSLILLAAYLTVINRNMVTGEVTSFFTEISKSKNQRFQIGDMKIGSSLMSLKKIKPSAIVGVNATGQVSAQYKDGDATYTAFFGNEGSRSFSYIIRYDNVFNNTDEDAVINEISEKYGSPSTNSCNARITDGVRACKFTWWLPDGIILDAVTRQPIKDGEWLNLTIIATDTRLKNRIQRGIEGTLIKGAIAN